MRATVPRPSLALVLLLAACQGQDLLSLPVDPLDYVQAEPYGGLLIEIDAADALELDAEALDSAALTLTELLDKPLGVGWELQSGLAATEPAGGWTEESLRDLATGAFDGNGTDIVHAHVLLLSGRWAEDPDQTLAVSWANRHVAVFADALTEACTNLDGEELNGQGQREKACEETQRIVLLHELGHVIGLVNNGLPVQSAHEDADHPFHDVGEDCLMHHSVEDVEIFERVRGTVVDEEPPLDFDAACREDVTTAW